MENLLSLSNDWQKLEKEDLKKLLKNLKYISSMIKDLWRKRWMKEYDNIYSWKAFYFVEYYPSMSLQDVKDLSIKIYSKSFNEKVSIDEIIFKENPSLDWWLRIFSNYNMLDLSYKKIESFLLK